MSENRCSRTFFLNVNSVINFRRVTHFWLCLLETQVTLHYFQSAQHCNTLDQTAIARTIWQSAAQIAKVSPPARSGQDCTLIVAEAVRRHAYLYF